MKVLVINCGSSSLKYQLIDSETENVLAKGLCERIGIEQSAITHQPMGGEKQTTQVDMPDHTAAVKLVIEKLTDASVGVIKTLDEIDAVGHRIVHGGDFGVQRFGAASQSGKSDWNSLLPEKYAGRADGGCI